MKFFRLSFIREFQLWDESVKKAKKLVDFSKDYDTINLKYRFGEKECGRG